MKKQILIWITLCLVACKQTAEKHQTLVIGTYTDTGSEGIYTFDFKEDTADFELLSTLKIDNPSFMTISDDGDYIYSVSENDVETSAVNTIKINELGEMEWLNKQRTYGDWACHIEMSEQKELAIASNYGGGSISVHRIDATRQLTDTIQLIKFPTSEEKPSHAHSAQFSPDGKFLFVADLGNDSVYRFDLQEDNKRYSLIKSEVGNIGLPPHTGPRHFKFDLQGKYMYVLGEYSGKVHVYAYNNGIAEEIQSITTDDEPAGGSADIHISPDGKFLYTSNRLQHDGIAIMKIDVDSGKLTKIGYQITGKHPRNFRISPNGKWMLVACRDSDEVQIYAIDKNGLLADTNKRISLKKPVFIGFKE